MGMLQDNAGAPEPNVPPGVPAAPMPGAEQNAPNSDQGTVQEPPEARFESLRDQGVMLIYDERFEALLKMFKTNGAARFSNSMATAVNTVLTELEKKGPVEPEMAAMVGMDIYMKLLEDIITGGVVPDVTLEQVQPAMPATLKMYAASHPEVTEEDMNAIMQAASQGMQQQGANMQEPGPEMQPDSQNMQTTAPPSTLPGGA